MTLDYFRYLLEFFYNVTIVTRVVQKHADVGACLEADESRINLEFRALYNAGFNKPLNTLVNGSARNIALPCNFEIRNPGVFCYDIQYLLIQIINLNIFSCIGCNTKET